MERLLPQLKYAHVPPPEQGHEVACEILEKAPSKLGGLAIARLIIEQEGWQLHYRDTLPTNTTIRSLLVPMLKGGFSIVLNEHRLPPEQPHRQQHEAFLIGHEIAHSLFYTQPDNKLPRRITGTMASMNEELFCDAFGETFQQR